MAPGCALKLGNQRNQNTAIGRLEAGRSQVRENYVYMNLTRLGDQPIFVMCAWPDAQWRFVIGLLAKCPR
jgi:hypothetical protein